MIKVCVLKREDWSAWLRAESAARLAGSLSPYGLGSADPDALEFTWSDALAQLRVRCPTVHKALWKLDSIPFLNGLATTLFNLRRIRQSDAVITFFENEAGAACLMRRLRVSPLRKRPLVVVACWLAEESAHYSRRRRRSWEFLLGGADALVVFSSNQVALLESRLGVPGEKIHVVPFGVDVDFFSRRLPVDRDIDVLAVGRDRSRDFTTLLHGIRGLGLKCVIVTSTNYRDRILATVGDTASNLEIVTDIDHEQYAHLLNRTKVVVTTTNAPAYPSGQTVLLEAMSAQAVNIVTRSPAMEEYGEDERTLHFIDPGHPVQLAQRLCDVLSRDLEPVRTAALHAVKSDFSHQTMWASLGSVISGVVKTKRDIVR